MILGQHWFDADSMMIDEGYIVCINIDLMLYADWLAYFQ